MAEPVRWQDAWWHQQPDGTWLRFDEEKQEWEPVATVPVATVPVAGASVYQPQAGMTSGGKWAIGLGIALVVVLILAILAAIAIPVFLSQREKEWTTQVESLLKNAAVAQESYCTVNESCYTDSVSELEQEGLRLPTNITLTIVTASEDRYCMEARHDGISDKVWSYDSLTGRPRRGPCI